MLPVRFRFVSPEPLELIRQFRLNDWNSTKRIGPVMQRCGRRKFWGKGTPEQFAGIDVSYGLELLSGNRLLYLDMLHKFLDGHRDVAAEIRRALAADEWDVAQLLAHNTKGVCGCIGATGLQERAAALEWAIVTQNYELDTLLHQFETELDEVMADLESKLHPNRFLRTGSE